MATTPPPMTQSAAASATLDALRELFAGIDRRDFAVRLWDGTEWAPDGAGAPRLTLVVNRPAALRRLLRPGSEAALAEAHLRGDLDIEGDIFAAVPLGRGILEQRRGLLDRLRLAYRLAKVPRHEPGGDGAGARRAELRGRQHTRERDRVAVTHHYDVSNRFYRLFLDPTMAYSCAYFADRDEELASAQRRKLDLICRKLRLRPGERFLDIGCGWGSLLIHAVREYDVEGVGITLSEPQAELARSRIEDAGLAGRCRVEVRDYRSPHDVAFDKVASVGMFEHVGRARAVGYFDAVRRALRPGGAYLHHAITANPLVPRPGADTLSNRYVFPDHELIPIGETLTFAEEAGFDVRDVEQLREHYALTLRRWVAALEEHHEEAMEEVGEATWRAWRLVFAGAAHDFDAGRTGVAQALLVRPDEAGDAGVPLGRWDWYASDTARVLQAGGGRREAGGEAGG